MSVYGYTVTKKGHGLMAKLLAGETLNITRVMVGKGRLEAEDPTMLDDLLDPVALATSTEPIVGDSICSFIVEYRNNMNEGLNTGFWLNEYGVFAEDPDLGEILMYYASLGESPQKIDAYDGGNVDTRRYPVSITLTTDLEVSVSYPPGAWMDSSDVAQVIERHNVDGTTHFDIRGELSGIKEELATKVNISDFNGVRDSLINSNLLINGSLRIWQRATSFTNPNNTYTADRIKCNGTGTITPLGNVSNRIADVGGMILTGNIDIRYIMERSDYYNIDGKTLTFSYNFNGSIINNTFIADTTTCPVDGQGRRVFSINPGAGTLYWIKLEVGNIATPFVARPIAENLMLCLRYFIRFEELRIRATTNIAGNAYYYLPIPAVLRTSPTRTGQLLVYPYNSQTAVSGATTSFSYVLGTSIININANGVGTTDTFVYIGANTAFDAEL